MGDGTHKLPVKAEIRQAIGKTVGDTVNVVLEERIKCSQHTKPFDPLTIDLATHTVAPV
jgi:hypothetical protein